LRRLLVVVALVLVAAFVYRSQGSAETGTGTLTLPQPAPNEGERAPEFRADPVHGGDAFRLTDDGTYVLAFWSPLNESSSNARRAFEELAHDYRETRFAAVYVGAAPSSIPDAPYAVVRDDSGQLAGLYNVKRVPRTFLVKDGRIELVQNGFYGQESQDELREKIDQILRAEEAREDRRQT
jgi:hypothetical protein